MNTPWTLQSAFDEVLKRIRAQAYKPALQTDKDTSQVFCRYRTDTGGKCAFGHLIPDNVYQPEWDYNGGTRAMKLLDLAEVRLLFNESIPIRQLTVFASRLQAAHDSKLRTAGSHYWEKEMADIAAAYNLTYTEISA